MKYVYGVLCLLGTILPFSQFVPWVLEHGLNIALLIAEAGSTRIGAFAWWDVVVSAVALLFFIVVDGTRNKMSKLWLPILGTCTVGVSLGLPLFLLIRELHTQSTPHRDAT